MNSCAKARAIYRSGKACLTVVRRQNYPSRRLLCSRIGLSAEVPARDIETRSEMGITRRLFGLLALPGLSAAVCFAASPSDLAQKCRDRCDKAGLTGLKTKTMHSAMQQDRKLWTRLPKMYQECSNGQTERACRKAYRKCKGE